ncbi:MAG TPA: hypothetical protein VFW45_09160 [Candidatus Polarisedimenticolia bacterium]|nr:hypothetical protein [Candidatus Polarisedimenticolia bacterium]
MDNTTMLIMAIVVVVGALVAAALIWNTTRKRRSQDLRDQFGPEYDRAVDTFGGPRPAERELAARQKRVERLHIRPLSPELHQRFTEAWKRVQARFVDDPSMAVSEANGLVKEVMQARGYPIGDFEQRAADISVDHPNVVAHYRAARDIALSNHQGRAGTEELRQALVHYRSLFDELLLETPSTVRRVSAR